MLDKLINRKSIVLLILIITALMVVSIANAYPRQLSNDLFSDMYPETDGSNIVWVQEDGVRDHNIIYYDGVAKTKKTISIADAQGAYPQIDGGNVVWHGYESTSSFNNQIFLYDGLTTTQLSTGSSNHYPQISGNNVVWGGSDGGDYEIFLYNGSSVTTITNNNIYDDNPQISGNNVVWESSDGGDYEIFFYNGSSVTTLTDNNTLDDQPQISGNNIVWRGHDGSDTEIMFYNGSTVTTLTDNNFPDDYPQVSGNKVVWQAWDGSDTEIMFYNGSTVTALTANNTNDSKPQIDGNNIVWQGSDGTDNEIYLYDGFTTTNLTDDNENDTFSPQISGNKIVWYGCQDAANPAISGGGFKIATNPTDWEVFTSNVVPQIDPRSAWNSGQGNWSWDASKMTAGDFNNDGIDDVAVLYGYKTNRDVKAFVFLGNGLGGFSPSQLWWQAGPGNWDWDGSMLTSGDYNNDGIDDLSILYGYKNTRQTRAFVLTSNGINAFNSPSVWWDSGPNNWDWAGSKITSGDFDMNDGDDLAILYGYKNDRDVRAFVLTSATNSFNSPTSWFHAGPGNWDWAGSKLSSGDYNNDDAADLSILYGYKTQRDVKAFVFPSTGSAFAGSQIWWHAGPGNWDWNGSTFLSGDFTGAGGDDIAIFYAYSGAQSGVFVLPSDNVSFVSAKSWWNSGSGNWAGKASNVVAGDFNNGGRSDIGVLYNYGNSQTGLFVIR